MAKTHIVKCFYCAKNFDANNEPYEKPRQNRYAHVQCHQDYLNNRTQEEKYKDKLINYIKNLFSYKTIPAIVNKQINELLENYTYKEILQALTFHYEIKHGSKEKANGRIGIVPYVITDAIKYYKNLEQIKEKNEQINKNQCTFKENNVVQIIIKPPKKNPSKKKKNFFNFLNEEVLSE